MNIPSEKLNTVIQDRQRITVISLKTEIAPAINDFNTDSDCQ